MGKKTKNLPVRLPEEILQVMDKKEFREEPILMKQLHAELLVSLSNEADRVSKRNLKIATISCFVAVIALLISIIPIVFRLYEVVSKYG